MSVGLPAKKAVHRLVQGHDGYVAVTMRNDSLYALYTPSTDEGVRFIREFKLNDFDGDENAVPQIYTQSGLTSYRALSCVDNKLYMFGMRPEIFDLTTYKVLYSEYIERANSEWSESGDIFMYDEAVYRSFEWGDYSRGLDVVRNYKVVERLSLDLEFSLPFTDHYFYGFSTSSEAFCVYSLKSQTMLLELRLQQYCIDDLPIKKHVVRHENKLYVLAGNSVLLIDLELNKLVSVFNYVEQEAFQALLSKGHISGNAYAYRVSAANDGFVIFNARSRSFMMYVEVSGADMKLAWLVHSRSEVTVVNTEGDLLFGIQDARAKAWDKFSGEEVWQASAGTIASGIEFGDNWVVYTHPSGDLQCFKWKKPYLSPHRPS